MPLVEMGNPTKLVRKYHQLLDDFKADSMVMGSVTGFDTLDPVPPERLTRGMTLETSAGSKYISFSIIKRPPVEIGDFVYVIGRNYTPIKDQIQAIIIFSSREKWVSFSKDLFIRHRMSNAISWIIYASSCFIAYLIMGPFNYALSQISLILALTAWPLSITVSHLAERSQIVHCNSSEWKILISDVKDMYGLDMDG